MPVIICIFNRCDIKSKLLKEFYKEKYYLTNVFPSSNKSNQIHINESLINLKYKLFKQVKSLQRRKR